MFWSDSRSWIYVQSRRLCSLKEPECALIGVSAPAAYTQAMFAEVRHQLQRKLYMHIVRFYHS